MHSLIQLVIPFSGRLIYMAVKNKAALPIMFVVIIVGVSVLVHHHQLNFAISTNAAGNEIKVEVWNIGFNIMRNIYIIPFIIMPFVGIYAGIRYLIKSIFNKNGNCSMPRIDLIDKTFFEKPDTKSTKKVVDWYGMIIISFILAMTLLSFFLIYYYPYKSIYKFNKTVSDELTFYSYYFFPKKTETQTLHFRSNDSLLIHLWDPSTGGSDDPVPVGQVFLYFTKTCYVKYDPCTHPEIAAYMMKNGSTPAGTQNALLQLKVNDSLENSIRYLTLSSRFPYFVKPFMCPRYVQKRIELFIGSQETAEKLGLLLYELTGLTTVVNHVEGYSSTLVSHKIYTQKQHITTNKK